MSELRKNPMFCHIVSCDNNKGTLDKREKMFRIPKELELRQKWLTEIEKVQCVDKEVTVFNVCVKHFDKTELYVRRAEVILKNSAVPTIFAHVPVSKEAIDAKKSDSDKIQIEELKMKIAALEKEIAHMKLQHDIQLQHERKKAKDAVQSQAIRLKESQKEVSKKDRQLDKMEEIVDQMKAIQLISPDDAKFLNVGFELTI